MSQNICGIDEPVTPAATSRCPTFGFGSPIAQNCLAAVFALKA